MKSIIKLTKQDGSPILIGVESIIKVEVIKQNSSGTMNPKVVGFTEIASRHAMVTNNIVRESIDEIYNLINS